MFIKKKPKEEKDNTNKLPNSIGNQIIHQRGNIDDHFPSDFSDSEKKAIAEIEKFSMTSSERLVSLYRAVQYLEENLIAGDVVECGVWKGGCMMLIANALIKMSNQSRNLFLFDTFEGMTPPTDHDIAFNKLRANDLLVNEDDKFDGNNAWCYSSLEEVKKNMFSTGYNRDRILFIKGKVEDTLPYNGIDNIALLRLDTDWYESTKHEMENLYDKLVIGGVLIIDDYGHWNGAKKAVDEFIKERRLKLFLNRVDYTGRLAIKTH